MTRIVSKEQVAAAVRAAIPRLATQLPKDVYEALVEAQHAEGGARGRAALDHLVRNAAIACIDGVPICQDTGTVWVSLEIGPDVAVAGDVFDGVDAAVADAYEAARLRKSLVRDAVLDRANTGDNTPAFTDIHPVDTPGTARLRIMLKGGGSDNASRVVMLVPGAGRQAIIDEVVKCVREKAANACAPLVIGVGIGATFDKVGGLAKRALMRPFGEPSGDARADELERELLAAVNAAGVGPQGLGGDCAALGVRVATGACHIAALPVAVNMGCSAMRRATLDLSCDECDFDGQLDRQLVGPDRFAGAGDGRGLDGPDRAGVSGAAQSLKQSSLCATAHWADRSRCGTRLVGNPGTSEYSRGDDGPDRAGASGVAQSLKQSSLGATAHRADRSRCGTRLVGNPGNPSAAEDGVGGDGISAAEAEAVRLTTPLAGDELAKLTAGESCLISGEIYTLRDAGHVRLLDELQEQGTLPYGLDGATIFYAGPTPAVGDRPFGAVGPTTASRMDFAAPQLHDAGIVATIGKGHRSAEVREACVRNGSVYFVATGGAAALLAKQVVSSEVVAYDDLGTEALRRIQVVDFPVFVGIDAHGNDVYDF